MDRHPQGTARRVVFKAFFAVDHITPAVGEVIQVHISKNGGTFANPQGGVMAATAIGEGWYYADLSATDTDTLGPLIVRATNMNIDPAEVVLQIVDANSGGLGHLDASVSSRATQTSVDTIDDYIDTEVAAIKAKTDQLSFTGGRVDASVGAMQANVMTAAAAAPDLTAEIQNGLATAAALEAVDSVIDAIKLKVDANLDTTVSSRATQASVDEIDVSAIQADIAAIKLTVDENLDVPVSTRATSAEEFPTIEEIAEGVLGAPVEGSFTLRQVQQIVAAVLAGKRTITEGGDLEVFRSITDSSDAVTVSVDEGNNRLTVVFDLP